jgi:hypothetical protein
MGIGPNIGVRRIKWLQPVPIWKRAEAWRAHRKAMREEFETANAKLSGVMVNAQTSQSAGLVELAIKSRNASVQQEAAAVAERLDSIKVDKVV